MMRETKVIVGAILMVAPLVGGWGVAGATGFLGTDVPAGYAHLATPLQEDAVNGTVRLEGTVTATKGWDVAHVLVWLDDQLVGRAFPTPLGTWAFDLDTTDLVDGAHALRLCGMVTPEGTPGLVTLNGGGDAVTFRTVNGNVATTLFESTVRVNGASAAPWTFLVDRPYSGLRVSVTPAEDAPPAPGTVAQVVVTYHAPGSVGVTDVTRPTVVADPTDAWVASYGATRDAASTRSDATLAPGGVLNLDGVYAGAGGAVTVRVEALAAE